MNKRKRKSHFKNSIDLNAGLIKKRERVRSERCLADLSRCIEVDRDRNGQCARKGKKNTLFRPFFFLYLSFPFSLFEKEKEEKKFSKPNG